MSYLEMICQYEAAEDLQLNVLEDEIVKPDQCNL